MLNKSIIVLSMLVLLILNSNYNKLFSCEIIFQGHIKYDLIKKFDINEDNFVRYFNSSPIWNSNIGVIGVDKCISKQTVNNKNETIYRDTTCHLTDNAGKSYYLLSKSLRECDGAYLDQLKFVSAEVRRKLLVGRTCLAAYSYILGDIEEGYLALKTTCKIPDNIFKKLVNFLEDNNYL